MTYNCTITQENGGTRQTCQQADGQVILHHSDASAQPLRAHAPELAAWLRGGWEQDVRRGTQGNGNRSEAALQATFR